MASVLAPIPDTSDLREHLAEILSSASFRTSVRSQQFLKYVVEESLAGRSESLKERVVGERVFGRDPAYDTGQDSIVRVKANEVRRRLAQYYEQHPQSPLRIEMVSGSYGITIRRPESPTVEAKLERSRTWQWWALGVVAVLVVLSVAAVRTAQPATAFEAFWKPFLNDSKPLLLCMPVPEAYRIYGKDKPGLVETFRPRPPGTRIPTVTANWQDVRIVPEPGLLVGLGDARTMAYLQSFAATHRHEIHVRPSGVTTFADLSGSPSIVIGGETNQWSADLAKGSRFHITKLSGRSVVMDQQTGQPACLKAQTWEPPAAQDCGMVTRLRNPSTGHPLLLVAGLDHYGTYAVGEFVTDPHLLLPALNTAPAKWEQRNIQILFRVERLRDGVGPPQVLAIHTW